jgi:glucose-6-phosphate isomerase
MKAGTLTYRPAAELLDRFLRDRIVTRIWERGASVWGAASGSADARSIATRLGWLDVGRTMSVEMDRVQRLAHAGRQERVRSVYLLGMGGSSLCAEVMRDVFGTKEGFPELLVLDTTDEHTITDAAARMDGTHAWFIVASKSGTTVEVSSLERYFRSRVRESASQPGRQFIAITDPGTPLQELATSAGYREIFLNPADIGGRFSALSLFGLVPAALLGSSAADLLAAGGACADGCRQENRENPGLELGAFIGAAALDGRNKLTVILPSSIASLGLWIEQLIAESTGKHGKGMLPVVDEPLGAPEVYGNDRAFVAISTDRDQPDAHKLQALEDAGFPVLRLSTRIDGLGSEFFRWEFATAVAGAALGINPFDEPNVAEAKEKTKALLSAYAERGALPEPAVKAADADIRVSSQRFDGSSAAAVIREALHSLRPSDYVAFLSYLPARADIAPAIAEIRAGLREKYKVATTLGIGPRYLHSTGQYHKGGPNSALAIVLTGEDDTHTPIPDAGYTFSVLKRAQALGDVQTLDAHGRRTLLIQYTGAAEHAPARLEKLFEEALGKT